MNETPAQATVGDAQLDGDLTVPARLWDRGVRTWQRLGPRKSPQPASGSRLQDVGLATLLFDLLTAAEEQVDVRTVSCASTAACWPSGSSA